MKKLYLDVVNLTGNTLLSGRFVYISGFDSASGLYEVDYASYDDLSKTPSIGVLVEDTANDAVGLVKLQGAQENVDTSSVPVNTPVYLGLNGGIVFSNPALILNTNFVQQVGIVGFQGVNGIVILQSSFSKGQATSGGGGGGTVTGTGVSNKIAFWVGSSILSYNAGLHWDETNGRLGINTSTPLSRFDVSGSVAIGSYAGLQASPANGLIVSGRVGFGTSSPTLEVLTIDGVTAIRETADPTPVANYGKIYVKTDHNLYYQDTLGTITQLNGGGGGGSITGSGTDGQMTFWTGSSVISGNPLLLWDNTNNILVLSAPASDGGTTVQNSSSLKAQTTYWNGDGNVRSNVIIRGTQPFNSGFSNQLDVSLGDEGSEALVLSITNNGIMPGNDDVYDLGAFFSRWSNVYATTLHGNTLTTQSITTTFSQLLPVGSPGDINLGSNAEYFGSLYVSTIIGGGFSGLILGGNGNNINIQNSDILPIADGSNNLGGINNRWAGVYTAPGNTYHIYSNSGEAFGGPYDWTMGTNGIHGEFVLAVNGSNTMITSNTGVSNFTAIGASFVSVSSNYVVLQTDHTILVDSSGGVVQVTLPAPNGATGSIATNIFGRIIIVKKIDSGGNAVNIISAGGATIDGVSTKTITVQYDVLRFQSDGTNWWVI